MTPARRGLLSPADARADALTRIPHTHGSGGSRTPPGEAAGHERTFLVFYIDPPARRQLGQRGAWSGTSLAEARAVAAAHLDWIPDRIWSVREKRWYPTRL